MDYTPTGSASFIPDIWRDTMITEILHGHAVMAAVMPKPTTRPVWRDRSRMWQLSRRAFAALWQAVSRWGERRGFLEHDYCHECTGELVATTDNRYIAKWVPIDGKAG